MLTINVDGNLLEPPELGAYTGSGRPLAGWPVRGDSHSRPAREGTNLTNAKLLD